MKRYSICAHRYCERGITQICQCDSNPQAIVDAIRKRRITIGSTPKGHPIRIDEFQRIHIVESFAQPHGENAGDTGTVESTQHHGNKYSCTSREK